MKLDAAAYHAIKNLPLNDTVSQVEAEVWNKHLLKVADSKMKVQKDQLIVDLMRKLQRFGVGVNEVECYVRKSVKEEGSRWAARRRRLVQLNMKGKLEDAMVELRWIRERFHQRMTKLQGRWGHHVGVMEAFSCPPPAMISS